MNAEERLREIAKRLATENGLGNLNIHVRPFREFKVRYSGRLWVDIEVPDYVLGCPESTWEGLLTSIIHKILGKDDTEARKAFMDFCMTQEFRDKNRSLYLSRHPAFVGPVMEYRNLEDSLNRLKAAGLVTEDLDLYLTFWDYPYNTKLFGGSVLFRVLAFPDVFCDPEVPEEVLDYVVYAGYLYIQKGIDVLNGTNHDWASKKTLYVGWEEAEKFLDTLGMVVSLE